MKPNQSGMLSPYRQFGCFYEKNIENYLKSRQTISFNTNEGTSQCSMYPSIGLGFSQLENHNFKCETPTPEEYCEWYFKRYGIPKELKERMTSKHHKLKSFLKDNAASPRTDPSTDGFQEKSKRNETT